MFVVFDEGWGIADGEASLVYCNHVGGRDLSGLNHWLGNYDCAYIGGAQEFCGWRN